MNGFRVVYQDPFEKSPVEKNLSAEEALADFRAVDWTRLNADIIQGSRDVWEHFYFWEVNEPGIGDKSHVLNVGGEYTHGKQLQEQGPLLMLTRMIPRQVTRRGFMGLGAPRIRTVVEGPVMGGCTQAFAEQCVVAFLTGDRHFLETRILDRSNDG